jgi:hypothetical protein
MVNSNYLSNLSDEERLAIREASRVSREAKKLASSNIVELADMNYHKELASKYGIKMPSYVCQSSELKYVKRAARIVGIDVNEWVRECIGGGTLIEFAANNPNIGARGVVGLYLEYADEVLSKVVEG